MQFFISYAKKDTRELALKLAAALDLPPQMETWVDQELIATGSTWSRQIEREIKRCDYMIVLLSSDVNRDENHPAGESFVLKEVEYMIQLHKSKQIILVLVEEIMLPIMLTGKQYIDFREGNNAELLADLICDQLRIQRASELRAAKEAERQQLLEQQRELEQQERERKAAELALQRERQETARREREQQQELARQQKQSEDVRRATQPIKAAPTPARRLPIISIFAALVVIAIIIVGALLVSNGINQTSTPTTDTKISSISTNTPQANTPTSASPTDTALPPTVRSTNTPIPPTNVPTKRSTETSPPPTAQPTNTLFFVLPPTATATHPVEDTPIPFDAKILTLGVIGTEASATYRGVALVAIEVNRAGGLTLPDGKTYFLSVAVAPIDNVDGVPNALYALKQKSVVAIFGPDDDQLAPQALQTLSFAGLPVFTASTSLDAKVGGFVFRTQSNDEIRMAALVNVLKTDLQVTRIAVYQGSADFAPQAGTFVLAMAKQNLSPTTTVLQVASSPADSSASIILQSLPNTVAAFGTQDQVLALYQTMISRGFAGRLVTQYADQREFLNRLPADKRGNIYGVTSWSSVWKSEASKAFLTGFVANYGETPSAQAAAAYDGATALIMAIRANGSNPGQILTKMLTTTPFSSVQGRIDPSIGTGDLTQGVFVITTLTDGAPSIVARFSGTLREILLLFK